jgi:hypothetical protein
MDYESFVTDVKDDPVRAAVMLAMSRDMESEKDLIAAFARQGVKAAATMVSGRDFETRAKLSRNLLGLCLNSGLIEKIPEQVHPFMHAVHEASQTSRLMDAYAAQNFCVKAAVARCGRWLAVCFYGDMGMHELSAHRTIGLGVQVLGA